MPHGSNCSIAMGWVFCLAAKHCAEGDVVATFESYLGLYVWFHVAHFALCFAFLAHSCTHDHDDDDDMASCLRSEGVRGLPSF
jgi:hypothetical protein